MADVVEDVVGDAAQGAKKATESVGQVTEGIGKLSGTAVTGIAKIGGLKMALIALGGFVVIKAIGAIVDKINEAKRAVEDAKKRVTEFKKEVETNDTSLNDKKTFVNNDAKEYIDLSRKISVVDGAYNNDSLSDNGFERFLELNQKLANLFPEVVSGINDQGQAIINLGKYSSEATQKLQDLIEKEEYINNLQIRGNIGQSFLDYYLLMNNNDSLIGKNDKQVAELEKRKSDLDYMSEILTDIDPTKYGIDENEIESFKSIMNELMVTASKDLQGIVLSTPFDYKRDEETGLYKYYLNELELTEQQKKELIDIVTAQRDDLKGQVNEQIYTLDKDSQIKNDEKQQYFESYKDLYARAIKSTLGYSELKNDQDIADAIINSLDISMMDAINKYSPDDPCKFLLDKVVNKIKDMPESDKITIREFFAGKDKNGELIDTDVLVKERDRINKIFDDIKINLTVDLSEEDLKERFKKSLERLSQNSPNDLNNLEKFTESFDNDQIKRWLELTDAIGNATEAMIAWNNQDTAKTSTFSSYDEALKTLRSHAEILYNLNDEIKDTKTVSVNTIKGIAEAFPNMDDKLIEFQAGLIDTDGLFQELTKAYKEDEENFILYTNGKLAVNGGFYQQVVDKMSQHLVNLCEMYNLELDDCADVATAKLMIETNLINETIKLQKRLDNSDAELDYWQRLAQNARSQDERNFFMEQYHLAEAERDKLNVDLLNAEEIRNEFNETLNSVLDEYKPNTDWEEAGDKKYNQTEDTVTEFDKLYDWNDPGMKKLQEQQEQAQKELDDAIGYDAKLQQLTEYKKSMQEVASGYHAIGDSYKKAYEKGSKDYNDLVDAVGEQKAQEYLDQIIQGKTYTLEEFKGTLTYKKSDNLTEEQKKTKEEKAYTAIGNMSGYYDKSQGAYKQEKTVNEIIDKKIPIQNYELQISQDEDALKTIETQLQDKSLSQQEIAKLTQEQGVIEERLHNNRTELLKLQSDQSAIDNENAEYVLKQQQINERNQNMSKEEFDNSISELDVNKQNLISQIDTYKNLGGIPDATVYQTLINGENTYQQLYQNRLTYLEEELSKEDESSQRYNEIKKEINDINQSMDESVSKQIEWNNEILNLPLQQLNKQRDILQDEADQLNAEKAEYDNLFSAIDYILSDEVENCQETCKELDKTIQKYSGALSTANKVIDDRIELLNQSSKDITVYYDKLISPLELEVEKLQEANDERQKTLTLQKALWDLEKARNQKTLKVFKEGQGFVYEADEDSLRNAQEQYDNAVYNQQINDLQKQIKDYNKEKELLLQGEDKHSGIQGELEALEKLKNQYKDFENAYTDSVNLDYAKELFGEDFEDEVLNGTFNPDRIKDMLISLNQQKKTNEDIIEADQKYQKEIQKINSDAEAELDIKRASEYFGIDDLKGSVLSHSYEIPKDYTSLVSDIFDKELQIKELDKTINVVQGMTKALDGTQQGFISCFNNIISYLQLNNQDVLDELGFDSEAIQNVIDTAQKLDTGIDENGEKVTKNIDHYTSEAATSFNDLNKEVGTCKTEYGNMLDEYVSMTQNAAEKISSALNTIFPLNTGHPTASSALNVIGSAGVLGNSSLASSGSRSSVKLSEKHTGMKSGFVSENTMSSSDKKKFEELCLRPLKPNEFPLIALKGESVLTDTQQKMIMDNFSSALNYSQNIPMLHNVASQKVANFSFGDIILQGVQDVNGLAQAIKTQFSSVMMQELYK